MVICFSIRLNKRGLKYLSAVNSINLRVDTHFRKLCETPVAHFYRRTTLSIFK